MTENEMVGWHHRLNGHGFGWTPGVGDGQGGLACCGSWGLKESDTTELNCCSYWVISIILFSRSLILSSAFCYSLPSSQVSSWQMHVVFALSFQIMIRLLY